MRRPQTVKIVKNSIPWICPLCFGKQEEHIKYLCRPCNLAIDSLLDLTVKQVKNEYRNSRIRYLQAKVALSKIC